MFKLFWKTTISVVTLDQTYLKYILVPVLIWFAKTVHAYNIWALTGSFYPGYNLYDREKNKNNDIFKKLHVQGENKGHMGFSFLSPLVEKPFEGLIVISISGTFPSTVPSLSFPGFLFYFFVTSQTLP